MAVGDPYCPLQFSDRPFIRDMDCTFITRYGKHRTVVKDCIVVYEEFFPDELSPHKIDEIIDK